MSLLTCFCLINLEKFGCPSGLGWAGGRCGRGSGGGGGGGGEGGVGVGGGAGDQLLRQGVLPPSNLYLGGPVTVLYRGV
jgi:hypothetical protein